MTAYIAWNSAMPTTAARAGATTGTAIKTMLQIATPSTQKISVVKWGVRFESAPTAIVRCELVHTGTVAAVMTGTGGTAHVAAGVQPYWDSGAPASVMTLGTSATGYSGSAVNTGEGTIVATRTFDDWVAPIGVSTYDYEWSLGREPEVPVSSFLRVRMTTSAAVTAQAYVIWEE
jgi:hypothetical protein